MPNSPEMSRFLYTIMKQLDLKSINWNLVAGELSITNGHAARMRYSRFKQQMEGNPPIRRTRNTATKKAPRTKRPKAEPKDLKIKMEHTAEIKDPMGLDTPSLSPCLSMPSISPYTDVASMTPEAVPISVASFVKPEPADDISSSTSLMQPELVSYSRSHSTMPSGVFSPGLAEQQLQQSQSDPQIQVQTMADFHYILPQQQQQEIHRQQSQRIFQHLDEQHAHDLLEAQSQAQSQNLAAAEMTALIETREHDERQQDMESMPFLMDMPLGVTDMGRVTGSAAMEISWNQRASYPWSPLGWGRWSRWRRGGMRVMGGSGGAKVCGDGGDVEVNDLIDERGMAAAA